MLRDQNGKFNSDNITLSVIVRFHKTERLPFLEEAIFSLAIQHWPNLELIVAIQNGNNELIEEVRTIITHQPWLRPPGYKILQVEVPDGVDGRSKLLNVGIENAEGRFLAFLDDDDVVYQHGYTILINQLLNGRCTVAVGGCRTATTSFERSHWFIHRKETPFVWGRSRFDLFRDNFIPIHSYVIDCSRVGDDNLYFDSSFSLLEDYEFILRLCAKFEFDFSHVGVPVCEYRMRLDGSNSIPHSLNSHGQPPDEHLHHARQRILEVKRNLTCSVPIGDLADISEQIAVLIAAQESERDQMPFIIARKISRMSAQYPRASAQLRSIGYLATKYFRRLRHKTK
ncbi:MAG: glycosyltransferase [Pyrinomonadaceae bacterium]